MLPTCPLCHQSCARHCLPSVKSLDPGLTVCAGGEGERQEVGEARTTRKRKAKICREVDRSEVVLLPEFLMLSYQPYKLVTTGKGQKLKLIDRGHVCDSLSYCFVLRLRHTPPNLLSVIYADCAFTLVGQHLDEFEKLLDDERVAEIHVFNPLHHLPPSPGKPIIEKLRLDPRREAGERMLH